MNKIDKLAFLLKVCEEEEITAYKIASATGLSAVGIQKILNRETKNPNNSTLDIIVNFLERQQKEGKLNKTEEPAVEYGNLEVDFKKYLKCIETENKLTKEIHKLQWLLRKNNIEFKDVFEEDN